MEKNLSYIAFINSKIAEKTKESIIRNVFNRLALKQPHGSFLKDCNCSYCKLKLFFLRIRKSEKNYLYQVDEYLDDYVNITKINRKLRKLKKERKEININLFI